MFFFLKTETLRCYMYMVFCRELARLHSVCCLMIHCSPSLFFKPNYEFFGCYVSTSVCYGSGLIEMKGEAAFNDTALAMPSLYCKYCIRPTLFLFDSKGQICCVADNDKIRC